MDESYTERIDGKTIEVINILEWLLFDGLEAKASIW
jgi:hypothetical protein